MERYAISSLSKTAQNLIYEMKIDKNEDGYIEADNGELADLLSKSGAQDIQELAPVDPWGDYALGLGLLGSGSFLGYTHLLLAKEKYHPLRHRDQILQYHQERLSKYPIYKPKYTEAEIKAADPELAQQYRNANRAIEGHNKRAIDMRKNITLRGSINKFSVKKAMKHNFGRGLAGLTSAAGFTLAAIGVYELVKEHPKKELKG